MAFKILYGKQLQLHQTKTWKGWKFDKVSKYHFCKFFCLQKDPKTFKFCHLFYGKGPLGNLILLQGVTKKIVFFSVFSSTFSQKAGAACPSRRRRGHLMLAPRREDKARAPWKSLSLTLSLGALPISLCNFTWSKP